MKDSHIQWTDNTFNPWEGCTKVSPGCLYCYAETRNARFGRGTAPNWGAGKARRRTSLDNWREPLRWNRKSQELFESFNRELQGSLGHLSEMMDSPTRPRVFCASLADWLDAEVPIEWLADLLVLVFDCGFLDWQLLTKRPENFKKRLLLASTFIRNHRDPTERNHAIRGWIDAWVDGKAPHNVWVGVSVEDQLRADIRIPALVAIPAFTRFLSCEPLLGRLDLTKGFEFRNCLPGTDTITDQRSISWVIVGGESGKVCRKTNVDWIENLIGQCKDADVACFVKQLGARPYSLQAPPPGINAFGSLNMDVPPKMEHHWRLAHPKGGDPTEWPQRFQVAQFPEVAS